jgi:MoaA/NifB/PqqE/SkfB family radical SAM enzyme
MISLARLARLGVRGVVRELRHRLLTRLDLSHGWDGWAGPPYSLAWWLTERCNMDCEACWVEHSAAPEMTAREWLAVAEQVRQSAPRITLTGGEPLLHPEFLSIARGVKERGLYLSVNSNGLLLGTAAADLVALGADDISISVDGMAATHDAARGVAGSFARVMDGLATLLAARGSRPFPIVRVNTLLSAANIPELEALHHALGELGVDCHSLQHRWFVSPSMLAAHHEHSRRRLGCDGQALRGFLWDAPTPPAGLAEAVGALAATSGGPRLLLSPELDEGELARYYGSDQPLRTRCVSRWYRLSVLPDGQATPCLGYLVGSVRERPFDQVWNGPEMRAFRLEIARGGLLPGCFRCCGLFSDQ